MKKIRHKPKYIIGIDEVGRGALAGPVVVAALALPQISNIKYQILKTKPKLKDSKKLSKKNKERARDFIERVAFDYSIVYKENDEIDSNNILSTTLTSMHEVIDRIIEQAKKDGKKIVLISNSF